MLPNVQNGGEAAAASHATARRSLAEARERRSPRDATARMNTLQACYMHELLQASFRPRT